MLVVSIGNVALLIVSQRRRPKPGSQPDWERRLMHIAAVVFTIVCAYRALLPRIDVTRTCWYSSPLNWVLFGRLAAHVAEVCWATQMGLLLRRLGICLAGRGLASNRVCMRAAVSGLIVIALALVAECWSWTNLITQNNIFAVVEQAIWLVLFLITGIGFMLLLPCWPGRPWSYWVFGILAVAMGIEQGYEAFGLYFQRYLSDEANGVHYSAFAAGVRSLASCATVTRDINAWSGDLPWMTGYFSAGVWSSIWLASAPLPGPTESPLAPRRLPPRLGTL